MNRQNTTFKNHDDALDLKSQSFIKASYGKLCETEIKSNLKLSQQIHENNLKKYFDRNPSALEEEIAVDFPTALSMFNLGIKNRKVQSSTL
jgi:hypothetical protein